MQPVLSYLSLHDALPIFRCDALEGGLVRDLARRSDHVDRGESPLRIDAVDVHLRERELHGGFDLGVFLPGERSPEERRDRKSTRLNSSHVEISYAVVCLK